MQKQPDIGGTWPPLYGLPIVERATAASQVVLAGQRVLANASARHGVHSLFVHPHRVLSDMQTGAATELSRTPAGLIRRIHVDGVEAVERLCVAGAEPVAAWCWRAERSVDVHFSWKTAPVKVAHGDPLGWRADGQALRAALAGGRLFTNFAFSEPVIWSVAPGAPDTLSVNARLQLPHDRDVWLIVAAAHDEEGLDRIMRRLRDAARIPTARAAAFRKRAREHLTVTSSDETLARTVLALTECIDSSLIALPQGAAPISEPPHDLDARACVVALDACTIAAAAAAIGDTTIPRATLRFLQATRTADGLVPASCFSDGTCSEASPTATAAWISLAATCHASSGDDALLRELWPDLIASARRLPADRFGHALRALAVAAETAGDAAAARDFRRAPATGPTPRSLAGAHARVNVRAAHHLLKLIHRRFGLEPDAPRGRLRARFVLPTRWRNFRIDNVRVGDTRVSIEVDQDAHHARFSATPTAGAIPIRLILEPSLSRTPRRITIDGTPAQLDLVPRGNRVVAPVQIELDYTRIVEFSFQE